MAEETKERGSNSASGRTRQTKGASRPVSSDRGSNLNDLLAGIGVSQEKANMARSYVVTAVESKVRNMDSEEAIDKAVVTATRLLSSMRDNARKNPAMFFSGLTAAALGIGMMVGAARERESATATRRSRKNVDEFEVE